MGTIKVKKGLVAHFLHDLFLKGVLVQFAYDVPGVVGILTRGAARLNELDQSQWELCLGAPGFP